MKIVSVTPSIDDSTKFQKLIDSTGNTPAKFVFSDESHLTIQSRIRFWNNVELDGCNSTFELMENARTTIFGEQVSLIGSKLTSGVAGWDLHSIIFEGNRDAQKYVPLKNGKNWGLGYHNFIGPFDVGMIQNVARTNANNIRIHDCEANNNLGDFFRCEGGTDIKVWNCKGKRGGHDFVNFANVLGGEIYNLNVECEVNAGIRTRSATNIDIHDNYLSGASARAYAPLMEIQETAGLHSGNINIFNNKFYWSFGPGTQVVSNTPSNGTVFIHNNLYDCCGQMPASENRPNTGAIVFDGFPVDIRNNTIVKSRGYGILAGAYDVGSTYKNTAHFGRNIITDTQVAYKPGIMSGGGIVDLTGRYTITSEENCLYGNLTNYYKVVSKNDILTDPLFTDASSGNYHLQSKPIQPCVFHGYELGAYDCTAGAAKFIPPDPPCVTISKPDEATMKVFCQELLAAGLIDSFDELKFSNISDDFEV